MHREAKLSRIIGPAVGAAVVLVLCSCGGEESNRKPTFPVVGQVYVDGEPPGSEIKVVCHDVLGMDETNPTVSQSFTGDDGRFRISTYESGDGVPPGEYVLTFEWGRRNVFTMSYGGPDKLKGRYKDPKKSEIRFTVTAGQQTDLGRIELTTK